MRKLSTKDFIEKANIIHNNIYDYSLSKYITSKEIIIIICNKHGIFKQTADSHLRGHGCPKCSCEKNKQKLLKSFTNFVINANNVHNNKYNYIQSKYVGAKIKIDIICNKHGIFKQTPDSHLRGSGCPKCVNRNCNTIEYIEKANLVHNFKYDYKLVEYINPKTKIKIICKKHGIFEQTANSHLRGSGCPTCKSSKGELMILKYLNENNVKYIRQKRFQNCFNKYRLPFDFYLPDYNILIEFDGKQHEQPINFYGISNKIACESFNNTKTNDNIKNTFAQKNNIKLFRISYREKNIKNSLDEIIKSIQ
jgi:hypothetical protein